MLVVVGCWCVCCRWLFLLLVVADGVNWLMYVGCCCWLRMVVFGVGLLLFAVVVNWSMYVGCCCWLVLVVVVVVGGGC